MPVQKQVLQRLAQRDTLGEKDVPALSLLSVALRSQLRFNIQRPHLLRHPVFRLWISLDLERMIRLSSKAISFIHLRPKDELFTAGGRARSAYSLVEGEILYVQSPDSSPVEFETAQPVAPGTMLCEGALWTEWTHVGRAEATQACTLLEIHAERLVESLHRGTIMKDVATEYCKQYHKRVIVAGPPHAPWPTDLDVPFTDYCDLVVCMAKETQVAIGQDALVHLAKGRRSTRAMEKLGEEVRSAKSIVVVTGEGSIIRVVSLVVLLLERSDRRIFAQVGKWDGSALEADCRLPGLKMERDELLSETVTRMLGTKLPILDGRINIEGTSRQHTEKMSKEYGVQSRYMRTVCRASLQDEDEPLDVQVLSVRPASATAGVDREDGGGSPQAVLQATDVLQVVNGGGSSTLFAWLPSEVFEFLSAGGSAGDQMLKSWLAEHESPLRRGQTTESLSNSRVAVEARPADGRRGNPALPKPVCVGDEEPRAQPEDEEGEEEEVDLVGDRPTMAI
mmetsp:Transcript_25132/g.78253  ORF Transcript_25132/g.78253 Transcript_25132/m.78253 type:complete len:508 (-) Transcript_25132:20-1543(-)